MSQDGPGTACTTCARGDRDEIDRCLLLNVPIREVAKRFGIPRSTLADHASGKHHASVLGKHLAGPDGVDLAVTLRAVMAAANDIAQRARAKGDLRAATSALAEVARCADLLQRGKAAEKKCSYDCGKCRDTTVLEGFSDEDVDRIAESLKEYPTRKVDDPLGQSESVPHSREERADRFILLQRLARELGFAVDGPHYPASLAYEHVPADREGREMLARRLAAEFGCSLETAKATGAPPVRVGESPDA
jgi:hypothetical protein